MSQNKDVTFLFGIYPGGVAGAESETGLTANFAVGKPDDLDGIRNALNLLQGSAPLFIIRNYIHYEGNTLWESSEIVNQMEIYRGPKRKVDLVLCYQTSSYVQAEWEQAISNVIDQYGPVLHSLQIAEEPNMYHFPGDGIFPQISQVIVDGIKYAKQEISKKGFDILVGFNAVPCFNNADPFWNALTRLVDEEFLGALGYVGLDFFPDVFRPIAFENLTNAVNGVLNQFRLVNLANAGIGGDIPIHITENGWATGADRSYGRQGQVLETIIRQVYQLRKQFNITQYELFSLRDADTANPDLFHQFGILRDDYSVKPAFLMYQRLTKELSC
ncbi:MAG TPA: hypothetical protein VGN20_06645 [Mucilaginibacter sp.]|jgi:hypothetical protein